MKEIHDKVCQIYNSSAVGTLEGNKAMSGSSMMQTLGADHKRAGPGGDPTSFKEFKNTKVVVWLTNRPIEEEKHQRKQFFKKLN